MALILASALVEIGVSVRYPDRKMLTARLETDVTPGGPQMIKFEQVSSDNHQM